LVLRLPNETLDRVLSARLFAIQPQLLVHVLTISGILIVLDLTRFMVDGHLPHIRSGTPTAAHRRLSKEDPLLHDATTKGELDVDQTVTLATTVEDLGALSHEQ
jgi:hypothetical protein